MEICFFTIVNKQTDRGISSDNEWQRVVQQMIRVVTSDNDWEQVTTSDNEWQQMIQGVTTNENEWQGAVQRMTTSDNEWDWIVISANFLLILIREEPTIKQPKEKLLNDEEEIEEDLLN